MDAQYMVLAVIKGQIVLDQSLLKPTQGLLHLRSAIVRVARVDLQGYICRRHRRAAAPVA